MEEWMDAVEFPWMTDRLQRGDVVSFSQLEQLSDEAAVDRQSYLKHRVKPQVAVPLLVGSTVVGGLVFSAASAERTTSGEMMEQLNLVGDVFAHALSRKQGELEARRLRQELTHIGRVSALGELTASLAHELNQPLTAILSNAQAARPLLAVVVAVEDSGIGIDEKDTERIFEPLYTTKQDGLGMGLAIARTIINAHGGQLEAASNIHGGATFQFTLPVDTEDAP